jgi:hypothetical protein
MITPYIELDTHVEHKETHQYSVRSIYFDTPNFDYYFDKLEGVGSRKKVRLRVYHENTDESLAFLEVKKKYEVPLKKFRAPLKAEDIIKLFKTGDTDNLTIEGLSGFRDSKELAKSFFYYLHAEKLQPIILVSYEREPYNSKFDPTTRITFDKNLRSFPFPSLEDIYRDDLLLSTLGGQFILEIKYNHTFPNWMKPIIAQFRLRSEAVSKYLSSIDAHNLLARHNKYLTMAKSRFY